MISWAKENRTLIFLVFLTALSSVAHYVHNIVHFEHYPEPDWLNPQIVDFFWFIMTPFAILGLYFNKKRMPRSAFSALTIYSLMNMLTLLHYACDAKVPITFTIHFFIWFEAVCAAILLFYIGRKYGRVI